MFHYISNLVNNTLQVRQNIKAQAPLNLDNIGPNYQSINNHSELVTKTFLQLMRFIALFIEPVVFLQIAVICTHMAVLSSQVTTRGHAMERSAYIFLTVL